MSCPMRELHKRKHSPIHSQTPFHYFMLFPVFLHSELIFFRGKKPEINMTWNLFMLTTSVIVIIAVAAPTQAMISDHALHFDFANCFLRLAETHGNATRDMAARYVNGFINVQMSPASDPPVSATFREVMGPDLPPEKFVDELIYQLVEFSRSCTPRFEVAQRILVAMTLYELKMCYETELRRAGYGRFGVATSMDFIILFSRYPFPSIYRLISLLFEQYQQQKEVRIEVFYSEESYTMANSPVLNIQYAVRACQEELDQVESLVGRPHENVRLSSQEELVVYTIIIVTLVLLAAWTSGRSLDAF